MLTLGRGQQAGLTPPPPPSASPEKMPKPPEGYKVQWVGSRRRLPPPPSRASGPLSGAQAVPEVVALGCRRGQQQDKAGPWSSPLSPLIPAQGWGKKSLNQGLGEKLLPVAVPALLGRGSQPPTPPHTSAKAPNNPNPSGSIWSREAVSLSASNPSSCQHPQGLCPA